MFFPNAHKHFDIRLDDSMDKNYEIICSPGAGMVDSRENCWNFFIDRVRKQLKIVLCFSPVSCSKIQVIIFYYNFYIPFQVGATLRVRSRKFPAIINCTSINWFVII